jgi:hypothetical protein
MGAKISTTTNNTSLLDRTKEDIASSIVEQLGSVYIPYSERIVQHNITGAVLWSFRKELHDVSTKNLIQYILNHDLNITNNIHQRVLYLEYQKLIQQEEFNEDRLHTGVEREGVVPTNIVMRQASSNPCPPMDSSTSGEFSMVTADMTMAPASNTVSSTSTLDMDTKNDTFHSSCKVAQDQNTTFDDPADDSIASTGISEHARNKVVLSGYGPIRDVTQYDVSQYEPSPTSLSKQENDSTRQRTASLPMFHNEYSANRIENLQFREHIPDNYYSIADQMKIDHTPIHINDADRVALLESFSLQSIVPTDPTGIALKRITVCHGLFVHMYFRASTTCRVLILMTYLLISYFLLSFVKSGICIGIQRNKI